MDRVLLYSSVTVGIKITIEAYFDEGGKLVVDGYDLGKTVEEYWGDSDYEYSCSIEPAEVDKLYLLFDVPSGDKAELLKAIQSRYHTNYCYSEYRDFLSKNQIHFESFSWN